MGKLTKIYLALVGLVAVAALVIALSAPRGEVLGGAGAYEALQTWFGNGLYAGANKEVTITSAGALTAKSVTVTNSSATSTIAVGNIQTTATSSATTICLIPSTAGATSTFNGTVYFKYGTCPF